MGTIQERNGGACLEDGIKICTWRFPTPGIHTKSFSAKGNQGGFMREYEIRVLGPTGSTSLITLEMHLTDNSAIRSGRKMANGAEFEIWRGTQKLYESRPSGSEKAAE
jgi:hypothetical protein